MSTICPVCNHPVRETDAACPACGFKLLGTTQQFEPIVIDGQETEKPTEPKKAQNATLTVVRGEQIGTVYTLDDKVQTIGRDPQCDILLNDMTVSRCHASIKPKSGQFEIEDASSYNGIWINNKNVDTAILQDKDIIQIGSFCLLYER